MTISGGTTIKIRELQKVILFFYALNSLVLGLKLQLRLQPELNYSYNSKCDLLQISLLSINSLLLKQLKIICGKLLNDWKRRKDTVVTQLLINSYTISLIPFNKHLNIYFSDINAA